MERTEIIAGRWKVKRTDPRNWQVFELREVKESAKTDRAGEIDWMACPAFFGELAYALEWCADRETENLGLQKDLKAAAKAVKASRDAFLAQVEKALEVRDEQKA